MKRLLFIISLLAATLTAAATVPIRGEAEADVERIYQYISARNPKFEREVAEAFFEVGQLYGIRGDIAICQAIIETGWFRFDNGTHVPASAHNYCGLGVKQRGDKGCSFPTVREGVTAMMQHLFAYSTKEPLPEGESIVDPRFTFVSRGCAPTWDELSGRWAMSHDYGRKILSLHSAMMKHPVKEVPKAPEVIVETELPDSIELEILNELRYEAERNYKQHSIASGD
ncbi:MAG: glucosaminidase domain-containing protein [Duncaniella sp.]|nr:glucosaminidase domain-containing protein [Duncaniella sp.]